jgi:hypothetical protein
VYFHATVFLPPMPVADVTDAVAAALAPYDQNDYTRGPYDPAASWDRWEPAAGGAALPVRPRGLRRLWSGGRRVGAFAVPKRWVDFAALQKRALRIAAGEFDAWAAVRAAHPGARPLTAFDGQEEWLAQPAVQQVALAAATRQHPYFTFQFLLADPVATLADGRDAHLARAAARALSTYVYVTLDGDWLSEETGDRGADVHAAALLDYIDSVAPATILARVRCHA